MFPDTTPHPGVPTSVGMCPPTAALRFAPRLNMKPTLRFASRLNIVVAFILTFAATPALAQDADTAPARDDTPDFVEITPETRAAIDRGFAFLAKVQNDDGSYGNGQYQRHVGITALACLAFMADGNTPERGPYSENINRGLDFVLANTGRSGFIAANTSHGPMYGHGFATLFLAEAYGMSGDRDPEVRDALARAVRLIVNSQNIEGGWRYQPVPNDADLSVTICQVKALRAARNAGIHVPRETIENAISYARQCQNPGDGGFRYMLSGGQSAYPRSAAGVASLYYAGVYEDDAIRKGLDYLQNNSGGTVGESHFFYGRYYASQAMFLAGGERWATFYPQTRDMLLDAQLTDGSWPSQWGTDYAAAMSLLVLQMPNRLLPIFQR